jgi:hypothetical protein
MDIDLDEPSDTGFDIGSSMDKVADSLGLRGASGVLPTADHSEAGAVPSDADAASDTEDTDTDVSDDDSSSTDPEAASLDSPASRPAPKSWTKDRHEMWAKLPPEAQDYYEFREKQFLDGLEQYKGEASYGKAMKDVLSPYKPILAAQGIDEAQAVQYLMNAHYKLTQGTTEQRMAAYHKLGQDLRLTGEAPAASEVAPEIRQLQEKLSGIESSLTARQQAEANAARERAAKEVSDFASDKANPYFDEVADDIVAMIQTGHSLKDAYEKAVWANPVTRQKEIARIQTEAAAKLKVAASKEAEAAKRASSANVRGRETRRAPTEPKGTMDETMRDTLEKIRNRAH